MTDERLIRQVSGTSLLTFFALVFLFSIAFWAFAAVTDLQLMPGLSVSALAAFSPLLAGLIVVYQKRRAAGVRELLKRSFDFKRVKAKRWYVPVLLLMFAVNLVVYGLMRGMDMPLPALEVHVWSALLMFIAFFAGALGEELGWSGYVTEPLQDRWGALQASLVLGVVGVIWHLVPLLLSHRSPAWIAWWCLYALASRVLIVWLYNNTGKSVFAATLFHAHIEPDLHAVSDLRVVLRHASWRHSDGLYSGGGCHGLGSENTGGACSTCAVTNRRASH